MGDPAAARDRDEESGQQARVDLPGEVPVEPVQRLGVQPGRARVDLLSQGWHRHRSP